MQDSEWRIVAMKLMQYSQSFLWLGVDGVLNGPNDLGANQHRTSAKYEQI
jgi:hypothetical protein